MTLDLNTACLRIARAGMKLANAGNIPGGQALVKVADALMQGHSANDVLQAVFAPEEQEKAASVINEIAHTPSDVAQFAHMQKKAAAFDKLVEQQNAQKQAQAKKTAPSQTLTGLLGVKKK